MRKILSFLFTTIMALSLLTLAACGDETSNNSGDASIEESITTSQINTIEVGEQTSSDSNSITTSEFQDNSNVPDKSNSKQTTTNQAATTNSTQTNPIQVNTQNENSTPSQTSSSRQSSINVEQLILEENIRHEKEINELNLQKTDLLTLKEARINALKQEGDVYNGTDEYYYNRQSELRNKGNKLNVQISAFRGSNLSMSSQKKLKQLKQEKEEIDAELSALESAAARKRAIQDIETETTLQVNTINSKIEAENEMHIQNLEKLK